MIDAAAPAPTPRSGHALLRPLCMAVSAHDAPLPAAPSDTAPRPPAPPRLVLGHQFVARVESIEPADRHAAPRDARHAQPASLVGRRVVASPILPCGACDLCRGGLWPHCRHAAVLGHHGADGCFAQLVRVPISAVVPVPDTLADDAAALALPVARALHAAHHLNPAPETLATIVGDTCGALLAAQALGPRCRSLRLLGSRPEAYTLCERWGIKHRHIDEPGRRADQDVVIEATGRAELVELALHLVRPGGRVVLLRDLGAPADALPPRVIELLARHEITLTGCRGGAVASGVALLARGEIDAAPLITARRPLADGLAALAAARDDAHIQVLLHAA